MTKNIECPSAMSEPSREVLIAMIRRARVTVIDQWEGAYGYVPPDEAATIADAILAIEIDASGVPHSGIPRYSPGTASPEDFAALREIETEWLVENLSDAIANLAYPVGCGISPTYDHLKFAADRLFDRYAKMIKMARNAGGPAQGSMGCGGDLPIEVRLRAVRATAIEECARAVELQDEQNAPFFAERIRDLSAVTPSSIAVDRYAVDDPWCRPVGKTWTPDQFWEYVEGLAGEFEAGQMRDMMAAKGLSIAPMRGEWQPIETAPKGRLLLVGFFNSAGKWRSMHAQYRDDLPQHDDADDDDEPAEAGWYEGSLEAEMLFPVRPTHWQPLPAPPSLPSTTRECPNFPGCHCVDQCCDGWKHPAPEDGPAR